MTNQKRHQDYLLSIGTLAAGQSIEQIPLQLDMDADFMLTSRAVHIQSFTAGAAGQQPLVNYFDRIAGPDGGQYLSQSVTRFSNENPDFGQFGSPLPLRPPVIYPRGGNIMVDVANNGPTDFSGLEVYLRGYKVYAPGVLPCNVMPATCSPLPFIYPGLVSQLGQQANSYQNKMQVKNDADFILRSLSIGSMNTANALAQYYQLYIWLYDQNGKYYSNQPVHVDACFGAYGSIGSAQVPTFRTGNFHPPLLTPEIYVPANAFLYYDLYRMDNYKNGPGGLSPVDVNLSFSGMKVFHR